jgi:hypothetical protein
VNNNKVINSTCLWSLLIMIMIIIMQVLASKTKIYMVLEYVNGGELFDKIVRTICLLIYYSYKIHCVHYNELWHFKLKACLLSDTDMSLALVVTFNNSIFSNHYWCQCCFWCLSLCQYFVYMILLDVKWTSYLIFLTVIER